MDTGQFEGRKRDHIRLALDPDHQAAGLGGLDRVRLVHDALPDLDLEEVQLESASLGRAAPTPFYVAGMTAGHADAPALNRTLALACQERGWAMGVGSQRRELETASGEGIDGWRALRREVPRLTLFANLGVSQLIQAPVARVRALVDAIEAQALVVHANALQEALQAEGTPRFKGTLPALARVCAEIGVPVVLKETGCGFSSETLRRLRETGLSAVDVSGLGGTHWGRIEGARSPADSVLAAAAGAFAEWGEPTVESVIAAAQELPETIEIWASGGVRTGLDAAKLIALGARQVGFAKPALEAALAGPDSLRQWMAAREHELRVALFCTGCGSPQGLREKEGVWKTNGI
jgi:isopentenyl-diphosphate delta-isomerase